MTALKHPTRTIIVATRINEKTLHTTYINSIDADENATLGIRRGWLGSVFTRRAWRRRGLATALIAQSLVALRERGMTSAGLGVDAENQSGALGLYERMGFEVKDRFTAWRKAF